MQSSWASLISAVTTFSFWEFSRYRLIVTAVTVTVSAPYVRLRHSALA